MIPYRAMLDVPAELLRNLNGLLAGERRRRAAPAGSRKLTCREQAILALRLFRDRTRVEALGRDHGVSRATAYRYVAEAIDVLSQQAPGLPEALNRALAEGVLYVIVDGKVFGTDRCSETVTSVKGEQIVVAAALTPAVVQRAASCNTHGATTRVGPLADLLEPSGHQVPPGLEPKRMSSS